MNQNEIELEKNLQELISTPMGRRVFLQAVPMLLAGACATKSAKERLREGDNSGQKTSLTPQDEMKMTAEVLPQMRKDYPAIQNNELQAYITRLGQNVVRSNNLVGRPYNYTFTAVDVNYVNAFALPAGTVMVTAPLIAMAETEAELVGVIGHEVGHVKARHTAERMEAAKQAEKKTWLYGAVGGLVGGAAGFGLGRMLCKPKDQECLQKATLIGAAAGVGGTLLIQKYAFMANSREDEMEADRIGFRTSVAAGYHRDHVGTFYEKLLEMEKKAKGDGNQLMASFADAMSTHPPSAERVKQMHQMASTAPLKTNAIISTKEFEKMKALASQYGKKA
ncbi:MAG: M48 family metalloprotease [Bacteriovoracaceae bacterium]|nr:M48 family metalloprotease [Bacteriovoracaceae bacterium]